jgi:hypothetical protein
MAFSAPRSQRGACNHSKGEATSVTASEFRRIALSFPEAVESSHMHHPDFRVGGKIFATLGYPDKTCGMVKLFPDQQQEFVKSAPEVFVPVKGYWGRRGATYVRLKGAKKPGLRKAMRAAWLNAAPKKVVSRVQETQIGEGPLNQRRRRGRS